MEKMEITQRPLKVSELVEGFEDNQEQGVHGYDGKLNIRPPYQREFVYNKEQQIAVINSILENFPLNAIYWIDNGDNFEVLDGQQRIMSICNYIDGQFSVDKLYFHNQPEDIRKRILDYELLIYTCKGNYQQKIKWFEVINTAGEKLTEQELRNAIYQGTWINDAKKYFSGRDPVSNRIGKRYLNRDSNRQEHLETILKWVSNNDILDYMGKHQHDNNAKELWDYFNDVIEWIESVFGTNIKDDIKGKPIGLWYNKHKDQTFNMDSITEQIASLRADKEVTKDSGIYEYILTGEEKHLSLRTFDDEQKTIAYKKQRGICNECQEHFEESEMEADHILAWSKNGKTTQENCQVLCRTCNRKKSNS